MIYPGFIGAAYRSQSISAAGDLLINLYAEILESEGASSAVFYGTPGTGLFATLPQKPVRGVCSLNGVAFAVAGQGLFQLFENGTWKQIGGSVLPAGVTPVSMRTDGKSVCMGVNGYLWVCTLATAEITGILPAGLVDYSDGYFLVNNPGTVQFNISGLFNGASWDALDFGGKQGFPDFVKGFILDHRELWLFGSRTTEVWWNSGNANFPWQRIQGPYVEAGLGAPYSLARLDNTIFWLSDDERGGRMIWRANGYTPQRVSTFAIEYAMSTYARVDDAVAFAYQEQGHTFYLITFPSAGIPKTAPAWDAPGFSWDQPGLVWDQPRILGPASVTWVYDASSQQWHQRDFLNPLHGFSERVRGWVHAYAFGLHLTGDYQNGNIYSQSANTYADAYNPVNAQAINRIRRLRRAPHIVKEHKRISYPGFELHIQQGVVPQAGPGSAPQFNLRKSRDGGFTFSGYLEGQAALAGQYRQKLIWRRLGDAIDPVIEASSDEPMQHAWVAAYLNPDPVVSDR